MSELLPCPFCGGEAVLSVTESLFMDAWTEVRCEQDACDAMIATQGSGPEIAEHVIAAWNRRTPDPLLALSLRMREAARPDADGMVPVRKGE